MNVWEMLENLALLGGSTYLVLQYNWSWWWIILAIVVSNKSKSKIK